MRKWISVKYELPEDRGEPYQVIAAQKKTLDGLYEGTHRRIFTQDWHIREWPEILFVGNMIAWALFSRKATNKKGALSPFSNSV